MFDFPSLFVAEGPLNVFFQLPVTEISEVEDHKSVRAAGLLYFGVGIGGGVGDVGGDGDHKSRRTAAVLHFFGTKQIICCHQMAVPLT